MSRVRGKDTTPEMMVRRIVHAMGYRYRLHANDLPGKPDLVFPRLGKVILVHGCFWHMHRCRRPPRSRVQYWTAKFDDNKRRDRKVRRQLRALGWEVLVVWECWTKQPDKLEQRLKDFLAHFSS